MTRQHYRWLMNSCLGVALLAALSNQWNVPVWIGGTIAVLAAIVALTAYFITPNTLAD